LERRTLLKYALAAGAGTIVGPQILIRGSQPAYAQGSTIRVGILHSLSGTMAISEVSLKDVELMAIEEINKAGGVLGKKIEPVIEDGASDWPNFAEKAKKLIEKDKVSTVFGCWTSASRKAVLPVFEKLDHQLWYPVQYEGLECSKNIFYTGAAPNQQIEPAVTWLLKNKGKKMYLLGSDYVFPRTANAIIKAQLKKEGGTLVGEEYTPLGATEYNTIIAKIKKAKPDSIFSTLNGDSNVAFYKQMRDAGISAKEIPVMAVSVAEDELRGIGGKTAEGHYAAWNYFQSVDTPANKEFVKKFKAKFGKDRVTDDPIEAAYIAVYLWKQAVEKAKTVDIAKVRNAAYGMTFDAPEGKVTVDTNNHIYKTVRIGEILPTGQFKVVYATPKPVEPEPWTPLIQTPFSGCDWTKGGNIKRASLDSHPLALR
jgi:urea transport system substrate-binding protein